MGRRLNPFRRDAVLRAVEENDGQLRAGGLARLLGLHPQEVGRVLTALEDEADKSLVEDDCQMPPACLPPVVRLRN